MKIDRRFLSAAITDAAVAVTIALDHPSLVRKRNVGRAVNNDRATRYLLMRLLVTTHWRHSSPLVVGSPG